MAHIDSASTFFCKLLWSSLRPMIAIPLLFFLFSTVRLQVGFGLGIVLFHDLGPFCHGVTHIVRPSASVDNTLLDLLNSSYPTKAEFINCKILNFLSFCFQIQTWTALVKMVDDWRLALDSKKVTGSNAIDLSKAFDSICHNLPLAKLRVYGVGEEAIFYLSGRKQRVRVNGVFSDWLPVYCGVP